MIWNHSIMKIREHDCIYQERKLVGLDDGLSCHPWVNMCVLAPGHAMLHCDGYKGSLTSFITH